MHVCLFFCYQIPNPLSSSCPKANSSVLSFLLPFANKSHEPFVYMLLRCTSFILCWSTSTEHVVHLLSHTLSIVWSKALSPHHMAECLTRNKCLIAIYWSHFQQCRVQRPREKQSEKSKGATRRNLETISHRYSVRLSLCCIVASEIVFWIVSFH